MNEQKFAGVQGASFVNPYHGDSNQIYTPQDYTDVAKNIAKLASTTYAQIQDNAFRQGQIDQLAKNVDDERFFFKDTYLKGALYSKTQSDIALSMGKAQDIVNTAIANGDTAESVRDKIIESQAGVFDAAHEIAEVNPQAADSIIRSLQDIQGRAITNYQTQLVEVKNRNIVSGDWQNISTTFNGYMDMVQEGVLNPTFDNESFYESMDSMIGVMKQNAIIMGVDPNTYVGEMVHSSLSGTLASLIMDKPKHVALVNSMVDVARNLAKKGVISPSASTNIQTVALNKRSEANRYAEAKMMELTSELTPVTPENDTEMINLLHVGEVSGMDPTLLMKYRLEYEKKRNISIDTARAYQTDGMFPHAGSSKQQKAFRDGIDAKVMELRQQGVGEEDLLYAKVKLHTEASDIAGAKSACESIEQFAKSELGASGTEYTPGTFMPLRMMYAYATADNPYYNQLFRDNFSPAMKNFALSTMKEFDASIVAISSDTKMSPEEKKKAFIAATNKVREKWKLVNEGSVATGGSSSGGGGSGGVGVFNTASAKSLGKGMNSIYKMGLGFGGTGWNEDLLRVLAPSFRANASRFSSTFRANNIVDITDNEYNAMMSTSCLYKGTTGHSLVSPDGKEGITRLVGTNPNSVALAMTISDLASARTFQNGAKGTYDSDQSALIIEDGGKLSRFHIAVGGELGQQEYITDAEFRQAYNRNLENLKKDKTEALAKIINDGFTFDEVGVDYKEYQPNPNAPLVPEKHPEGYDRKREHARRMLKIRRKWEASLDKTLNLMMKSAEPMWEKHGIHQEDAEDVWKALNDPATTKQFLQENYPLFWEYTQVPPEQLLDWQLSKIDISAGTHDNYWESMFKHLFGSSTQPPNTSANTMPAEDGFRVSDDVIPTFKDYVTGRMYGDSFDGNGNAVPRLEQDKKDLFESFFARPDTIGVAKYNELINATRELLPDYTALLWENAKAMSNIIDEKSDTTPLQNEFKAYGGKPGVKTTFFTTGAIDKSVFGPSLGRELVGTLVNHEGFILDWKATDPRYTDKRVISLGYVEYGFPTYQKRFEAAKGDAVKLSEVTCEFISFYYENMPIQLQQYTGMKWDEVRFDPNGKKAILGCADYMWHAGRYATAYYRALAMIRNGKFDEAQALIKSSAAYNQSGSTRRKFLLDGLKAYNDYLKQ